MSGHADTISRCKGKAFPLSSEKCLALLAENQRLREALEGISADRQRTVAGLQGWAREALAGDAE